jgi:hypothetical protein
LIKSGSRSKSIARPLIWSPAGRAIMSECQSLCFCACVRWLCGAMHRRRVCKSVCVFVRACV